MTSTNEKTTAELVAEYLAKGGQVTRDLIPSKEEKSESGFEPWAREYKSR